MTSRKIKDSSPYTEEIILYLSRTCRRTGSTVEVSQLTVLILVDVHVIKQERDSQLTVLILVDVHVIQQERDSQLTFLILVDVHVIQQERGSQLTVLILVDVHVIQQERGSQLTFYFQLQHTHKMYHLFFKILGIPGSIYNPFVCVVSRAF